ncbi:MAG TPA: copper homeostasis periplasmic binding protein CopC [Acetobacteraceae bacterium]|nr:copper homeostasis periplasmic binding protein CopC [Acetobacteraceae bacterium]
MPRFVAPAAAAGAVRTLRPAGHVMLALILIVLALLAAPPAFAHAHLVRAVPPAGSRVSAAPPTLTLMFSEKVEPRFSQVQVLDPHGAGLAIGKPHVGADSDRTLVVDLPKLPPGTYSVVWRATSVDTHRTEGRFSFTVVP